MWRAQRHVGFEVRCIPLSQSQVRDIGVPATGNVDERKGNCTEHFPESTERNAKVAEWCCPTQERTVPLLGNPGKQGCHCWLVQQRWEPGWTSSTVVPNADSDRAALPVLFCVPNRPQFNPAPRRAALSNLSANRLFGNSPDNQKLANTCRTATCGDHRENRLDVSVLSHIPRNSAPIPEPRKRRKCLFQGFFLAAALAPHNRNVQQRHGFRVAALRALSTRRPAITLSRYA
jgi:hypothetical protein